MGTKYPRKKTKDLRKGDKEEIRKRIKKGGDNSFELAEEFGYSPSQIAGVKAALNRGKGKKGK